MQWHAHLYPDYWGKDNTWSLQWIADHITTGHSIREPVVLEEHGWLDLTTRDNIYQGWTGEIYQQGGNGDQFWILTSLQDDGALYPNYDGFRVSYPSSTASARRYVGVGAYPPQIRDARFTGAPNAASTCCRTAPGTCFHGSLFSTPVRDIPFLSPKSF